MILQKVYQFLRLFTIIKLLILIKSFYFTHILHSSESLVYNRLYIVYDYNHYNIVYKQCSIYSGTKLSISNFECPNFFTSAVASHYYTNMYALYRTLSHSCRSIRLQVKIFCPTCTISDRYT